MNKERLRLIENIGRRIIQRRRESLRLLEPTREQTEFLNDDSLERVLIAGNRYGKTLTGAVQLALAVTGADKRFPSQGLAIVVADKEEAIGDPIWKKLAEPGLFKIIHDPRTKRWRAVRPWDAFDKAHQDLWKNSEPLIPPRLIQEISYIKAAQEIPRLVKLKNGWKIRFFSGKAQPSKGYAADFCWMDEEVSRQGYYSEVSARLLDRRGRLIWTATPEAGTDQLYKLYLRGQKPHQKLVRNFHLTENPYQPEGTFKELAEKFMDDPFAYQTKVLGQFALRGTLIFPDFQPEGVHGVEARPIPWNWTRYAAIDPGYMTTAVLYVAVPPPDYTPWQVHIYDELYLNNCDITKLAEAMQAKAAGNWIEAIYLDMKYADQHRSGDGRTVVQQIEQALNTHRVQARESGFRQGCQDIDARIECARKLIRMTNENVPGVVVHKGACPWFCWELERYRYAKTADGVITKKPVMKHNHLMDCYDADTEVLSDYGWRPFSRLIGNERLATVNLESNAIEYQLPTALIAKPYSGDMFYFGGHKLNAAVTPNHRMVVYPKAGYRGYDGGNPVIKAAQDVTIWDSLKLHATWQGRPHQAPYLVDAAGMSKQKEIDPYDWAEFLGWYVAEGCALNTIRIPGNGYKVFVSQVKPQTKAILGSLLSRLPWNWTEYDQGFYASSKQLWEYLHPLGNCYTKRVPSWIKWANPEIIRRFMIGAILGDGWSQTVKSKSKSNNGSPGVTRETYATVSPALADDMQELFIKLGKSASIRVRKAQNYFIHGRHGTNTKDQYWVSEWSSPHGVLRDSKNKPNFETRKYEGMVYCASVPNSTLIVRRHGKPMVAGNCLGYLMAGDLKWVPPPRVNINRGLSAEDFWRDFRSVFGGANEPQSLSFGPNS